MRVAVTGITGTIGLALGDALEREPGVDAAVGVSRRAFDPASRGWTKVAHVRADVRDHGALERAFAGAEAVVHLAFSLSGVRLDRRALDDVNLNGTATAFAAARAAGARRFVHASSAAAYGVAVVPRPLTEDTPVRPDPRHFYAEQKALLEGRLREAAGEPGAPELTILRPCGVAGPHAIASSSRAWPRALRRAAVFAFGAGLRPALPAPPVPMQFLHQADAAAAFLLAALCGPAGTFNVAPDDALDGPEVIRELGFPLAPLPLALRRAGLEALAGLPLPLPAWSWLQLLRAPYLLDTSRARDVLGWSAGHSSRQALAATRAAWSA